MPNTNPLDAFDPNVSTDPWATYAPGRWTGGSFKAHKNRANAMNAMANHKNGCVLYEYVGGKWVERARFNSREFRAQTCDGCGMSTMGPGHKYVSGQGYIKDPSKMVNKASVVLERRNGRGSKLVEPLNVLNLCRGCYDGMGYGY